jgi:hypothetical protein
MIEQHLTDPLSSRQARTCIAGRAGRVFGAAKYKASVNKKGKSVSSLPKKTPSCANDGVCLYRKNGSIALGLLGTAFTASGMGVVMLSFRIAFDKDFFLVR